MPKQSVFQLVHLDLLIDLLYLAQHCAFGHCSSLSHFMLPWIDLFDGS